MEYQLSMNEAKVFDELLNLIIENQYELQVDQLAEVLSVGKALNYDYYLSILKNNNLLDYSERDSRYRISGKRIEITKLIASGGFREIVLKEQKEQKEIEEKKQLEMLKLVLENKNLEWQINTKWYVMAISVVALICSVISLLISIYK